MKGFHSRNFVAAAQQEREQLRLQRGQRELDRVRLGLRESEQGEVDLEFRQRLGRGRRLVLAPVQKEEHHERHLRAQVRVLGVLVGHPLEEETERGGLQIRAA